MPHLFQPAVVEPDDPGSEACLLVFREGRLLLGAAGVSPTFTVAEAAGLALEQRYYLGTLDGRPCYTATVAAGGDLLGDRISLSLREVAGRFSETLFALAGRAVQVIEWDRTHQYCGRCAMPTMAVPDERAKRCPACRLTFYPRINPAVIFLIYRGREMLLAHGHHLPPGLYSTLAGFVEPGETLEETVRREAYEEVGITVGNIRYFGSQPWPFPNSLMIGFTAEYQGGEITIEEKEIAHAAWFSAENLPLLSPTFSISRLLIDSFLKEEQAT